MNFVWVLVVVTSTGSVIPTLEFKTEQKCLVATTVIAAKAKEKLFLGKQLPPPICLKIEK